MSHDVAPPSGPADSDAEEYRALLAAEVALETGLVPMPQVADALRRFWGRRGDRGVTGIGELVHGAGLAEEQAARLRSEVDRLVREAGGDPKAALARRGGIHRSLHALLEGEGEGPGRSLARLGVVARTPLRVLPPDRYVDFRPLGAGGMGIVYYALDTELNRAVAFKVVRPSPDGGDSRETILGPDQVTPPPADSEASATFDELRTRFLQEAWVTGGMEHPGVVPVYELGQTEAGVPYYTMRLVKGSRTLARALEEAAPQGVEARLALLEPFLKVCDAVRYAHARGIVHRDLKPDNVALGEYGEAIVLDWGLAKVREEPDLTGSRWARRIHEWREASELHTMASALGTPGYMAPEAARGDVEAVGPRSDVYSLGAILFEILTGRLPVEFRTFLEYAQKVMTEEPRAARDLDPGVPQALSDLCRRALARDPADRTPSVGDLAAGIRAWQAQSAIDREVERLLAEAKASVTAARGLTGDLLLGQIDHARTAVSQVLQRRPGHPEAEELLAEVRRLAERGIGERERLARHRLLRRVALAALLVAVVAGAGVAWVLDRARRQAEDAADRARAAERVAGAERDRARAESSRADREAATATEQRDLAKQKAAEAEAALARARILALVNASAEASHGDSMLGLILAREAVRRGANPDSLSRLQAAFVETLERWVYDTPQAGRTVSVAVAPGGDLVLTASTDGTARLWSLFEREPAVVLTGHAGPLVGADFSPDGERVLTVGSDATARIFDRRGREVAVLGGHAEGPLVASFAPDGLGVVTGDQEGAVRLFRMDGAPPVVLRGHEEPLRAVAWSPTGSRIASASEDGTVRLWSSEGKQVKVLRGHEGDVLALDWRRDGSLLATASRDGTARLWDADGAEVAVLAGHEGGVNAVAFSPDGEHVATASSDRTGRVFDLVGRQEAMLVGHQGAVRALAWSNDGATVATASTDYTARLWSRDGRPEAVLRGHAYALNDVAWWPGLQALLTASDDGSARLWEPLGEGAGTYRNPGLQVLFACFSPDGEHVLTTATEPEASVWNLKGTEYRTFGGHDGNIFQGTFSPRGDRVATAASDGTARVFDREGGKTLHVLRGHAATVRSVGFHPTEERYVTASSDGTARLWDATGRTTSVLRGHAGGVNWAEFSPSGDRVVTCGDDGTVRLWDGEGRRLSLLLPSGAQRLCASFSPDGGKVVVASADHTARVLDLDGQELAVLAGHRDGVVHASFSPQGDRIATASLDTTARLFDLQGHELLVLRGHGGALMAASFSPDGKELVTAGLDGLARRWLLDPEALLALVDERATRRLTAAEEAQYAELLQGAR